MSKSVSTQIGDLLSRLDTTYTLRLLEEMISINSVVGNEGELAEYLRGELEALGIDRNEMVKKIVVQECLDRIEPDRDNNPCFEILELLEGINPDPLHKILSNYYEKLDEEKKDKDRELRKRLDREGISGSALIPNLRADPEWIEYVVKMKKDFQQGLSSLKKEMLGI